MANTDRLLRRAACTALLGLGVGVNACGTSADSANLSSGGTNSTSGTTGGAGTSGNAGGAPAQGGAGGGFASATGGALALGDSLTEACIDYALAQCQRRSQCEGRTDNCLSWTLNCPDAVFADGSTRSVASLKACAKEYLAASCEQIQSDTPLACMTSGTKQIGEACKFAAQCASLRCKTDGNCGVCAQTVGIGQNCSSPTAVCSYGLACGNAGTCLAAAPAGTVELGGSCAAASCKAGLFCSTNTSICVTIPTQGESCKDVRSCASGTYCAAESLTCRALPTLGVACGTNRYTSIPACADGLHCDTTSSPAVCKGPPVAGEPCVVDPATGETYEYSGGCAAGNRCDTTVTPPLCVAKSPKGGACNLYLDCADNRLCVCADGATTCAKAICADLKFANEPCTATGDVCHPGFTCTGGVCKSRDTQGLAAACTT